MESIFYEGSTVISRCRLEPAAARQHGLDWLRGLQYEFQWIAGILIWQRQNNQIRRLASRQAAGFLFPAQRLGAVHGCHAQEGFVWHLGELSMQETCLGENIQVGIGCQAVCAQGDANPRSQEFTKGM